MVGLEGGRYWMVGLEVSQWGFRESNYGVYWVILDGGGGEGPGGGHFVKKRDISGIIA